jgi:glycosyltransferase involved in cell wall biosynthesis
MTGPQFSIIIPTYNRAYILQESINSVLMQTCTDYELIVVDDGSTDHTPQLMRSILDSGKAGRDRIRYVLQEQRGKSAALNHGVRIARGEWIAFLDSDDIWLPNKLELQLRALQEFDCDVCFTDAQYTNNPKLNTSAFRRAGRQHEGTTGVISEALKFVIDEPHGIHEQTLVVRASRLGEMDGFDSNIRVLEDHDFVFRLANHAKRFCFVNSPLVEIDRTPIRAIGLIDLFRKSEVRLRDQQYIYEKWLTMEGLSEAVRRKIHGYLRDVYSGWANYYLEQLEYMKAREAMARAIQHEFNATTALKWVLTAVAPAVTRRYLLQRDISAQPDAAN